MSQLVSYIKSHLIWGVENFTWRLTYIAPRERINVSRSLGSVPPPFLERGRDWAVGNIPLVPILQGLKLVMVLAQW